MEPDPETVVETAAEAAESLVFSRLSRSAVDDFDVTVTFEDGHLDVAVYLEVSDPDVDEEALADDAALAAGAAADEILES